MKTFLWLWNLIPLSVSVLAKDATYYHNPLSPQSEMSSFAISATTGLAISLAQSQLSQANALHNTYTALSARPGVFFNTLNYRQIYLQANPYNVQDRIRIAEKIGDAGARAYAHRMNYQPIYQGSPGQGFDVVFRHGKQVVVVEAKGGSSQLQIYRGYKQGTLEYTLKVAEYVKNSKTASISAKAAADEVIKAAKKGRLVVQVSTTRHVQGTPQNTQVQTTYGKIDLPSPLQIAHNTSFRVGLGGAVIAGIFDLAGQWSTGQSIDWQRFATMSMLGGTSVYVGSMSGILTEQALLSSRSILLAKLSSPVGSFSGGMITSVVFSYGLYFLGYTNLTLANRSMLAGVAGTAIGGLAGVGLMSLATTIGTASTGTAIAGLSGAAATNAGMAWLGGGALSAGGFGMAGGAIVLTGGVALVTMGISAGIMYLFNTSDEKTERQRVKYLIDRVSQNLNS